LPKGFPLLPAVVLPAFSSALVKAQRRMHFGYKSSTDFRDYNSEVIEIFSEVVIHSSVSIV
jgi:hypothetical protein